MPPDPYSLSDLARLGGVTPRTIRYYLAQGLLPSVDPAGPATRYSDDHLARLRLIRRLQRDHLPLAEIRARLEGMEPDAIRAAADQDEAADAVRVATSAEDASRYVRELMARAGIRPRTPAGRVTETQPLYMDESAHASFEPRAPDEFPVREDEPAASPVPSLLPAPVPSLPSPRLTPPAHRSTWERVSIAPDVELHVRRPLDRTTNKRVDRLIRIARELFEEDQP